jgi:N-acetylglucosamine-6-phosphate deacetylase
MVTHFGNGCPVDLPRHDNVLQRLLHYRKFLWFCFIPDGVHVEFFALKNYIEFIGVEKCIVVTDAIAAAKMPSGVYQLSGISIEVDESGVARRPGSMNLAGSTITMPDVISHLKDELNLSEVEIERLISTNPRNALENSGQS